jgi:putative peptidoglycan lipid II flippase
MAPALLGVGVAQISLMINTQIASYLAPGSVTWLFYADRLMEFPTALLGVALGVVLTPAAGRRQGRGRCAALFGHARLGSAHRGAAGRALRGGAAHLCHAPGGHAVPPRRFRQRRGARLPGPGWAMGWVCWGWWPSRCWRPATTPARTSARRSRLPWWCWSSRSCSMWLLVPLMAHAGLALSIGLGALVNALWLLVGLLRRGSYRPQPGWARFALQVVAASACWQFCCCGRRSILTGWRCARSGQRAGLLAAGAVRCGGAVFRGAVGRGLKLRQMLRR